MGSFKQLIGQEKPAILHGALGTELEARGYDISGNLWSAKFLLDGSEVIQTIHRDYVLAGADIVTTSTYQASIASLVDVGLSVDEAKELIIKSVSLAKDAREEAWIELSQSEKQGRHYPLISGDVGPYAAYLADGSEYTGEYGEVTKEALKDFHRPRIALFVAEEVDLLALETMPNKLEIKALAELLSEEFPQVEAYLSITSQDGKFLSDGTPLEEVVEILAICPQILAVGVNCSSPSVSEKILESFSDLTELPLLAYPNSGEIYDGKTQTWHHGEDGELSVSECQVKWQGQFSQLKLVGGCCRTRPMDIARIKKQIGKI
ncbi:homocysteine S-methyltransferase [Streptococcus pluranimalium]|uniref:S-methylmethionine:homocysteine methyltransferase n=1 Tax=Streptococcus pluranimalium TaxID=82348 RepID=A0A345VHH7_9STRE|nr:homocysteine S-methyltransferase [Streptococcus pluranimalium]AXJ12179.1 Homocysteine S-methyltransferase [Streptococcus pluranimalium]